jgi:hypothetical protein
MFENARREVGRPHELADLRSFAAIGTARHHLGSAAYPVRATSFAKNSPFLIDTLAIGKLRNLLKTQGESLV